MIPKRPNRPLEPALKPLDDDLRSFVESGVASVAATASPDGRPHSVWVWGSRVSADGSSISVVVEDARASDLVADLRANPVIAIVYGSPVSYRSVQLKGRVTRIRPATITDRAAADRHRQLFHVETALVGDPQEVIERYWLEDTTRSVLEFAVERAFDQTPGPAAGREL
jgi:pyridoxine/pyridoxamine 5'-phosphate oxidase